MKEKDLDKLFRDALKSEDATPSPQLWDKIAQQLDEEGEGCLLYTSPSPRDS